MPSKATRQSASEAAIAETFITKNPFFKRWKPLILHHFGPDCQDGPEGRGEPRPSSSSERRTHREAELERLLRLQAVVVHAVALRVVGEDQPERHVQDRH